MYLAALTLLLNFITCNFNYICLTQRSRRLGSLKIQMPLFLLQYIWPWIQICINYLLKRAEFSDCPVVEMFSCFCMNFCSILSLIFSVFIMFTLPTMLRDCGSFYIDFGSQFVW